MRTASWKTPDFVQTLCAHLELRPKMRRGILVCIKKYPDFCTGHVTSLLCGVLIQRHDAVLFLMLVVGEPQQLCRLWLTTMNIRWLCKAPRQDTLQK